MGKYFGTDGFRGEANVKLTVEHAFKVGRYLGWYYGRDHKAQIVIGKDTRRSSYMFEDALAAGITASGADAAGGTEETGTPAVADRLQTLCNGEEIRAFVTLPLRELADGTYRILLSCEYTRDGQRLALSNDLPETEHGYEIASFTLSRTPAAAPAGRELIRRYLSHWSAQRALAK